MAPAPKGNASGAPQAVMNAPQAAINEFWENLITKQPAKVTRIFPSTLYAHLLPPARKAGPATGESAADSYQSAASECRAHVRRIVRECHRTNEKFTDPDFDIGDESSRLCLDGLIYDKHQPTSSRSRSPSPSSRCSTRARDSDAGTPRPGPKSVHRIDWIFDDPKFEIDGFESSDVRQGSNGDCWFIAAVATICSNPELVRRVCVDKDEVCGVYGFVFCRDGEWIWTVVDDNLYLSCSDFVSWGDSYDPTGVQEKKYKKNYQTGSEALFFASCASENETWLPLLEKAYAKVHGDYSAIEGGVTGEAIEDLTGGVTTKILTNRVLNKDRLWAELEQANKKFLFSASSPGSYGDDSNARQGIALCHAYSIVKAVQEPDTDGKMHRLVLIRNPWGKRADANMGEWTGPWSDGSKEWTPYWMEKLGHRFGDDGLFWISYEDLLKRFDQLDRTRLFDEKWSVVQHWTSVSVPWVTGFLNTKFSVEIKKAGPTVFVLCQLDDRYFRGLQGRYDFGLHFILQEAGAATGEHIVRARRTWCGDRSISAEVDLPPGIYEVLPQIEATRDSEALDLQRVVVDNAEKAPQKLRQIGLNYDIAHAKGIVEMSEEQIKEQERKEKEEREKKEEEEKERAEFEAWRKAKKDAESGVKKTDTTTSADAATSTDTAVVPTDASKQEDTSAGAVEVTPATTTKPSAQETAPPTDTTTKTTDTTDPNPPPSPTTLSIRPRPTSPSLLAEEERGRARSRARSVSPAAGSDKAADEDKEKAEDKAEEEKEKPDAATLAKQWNAVCVLGLRVFSLDSAVVVKLVRPEKGEGGGLVGNKE